MDVHLFIERTQPLKEKFIDKSSRKIPTFPIEDTAILKAFSFNSNKPTKY
jgi:hypothetical protein